MRSQLASSDPTLMVSLAENDPALAEAAVEAGADALKVHLNVSHRASGNAFGDVDDEGDAIREVAAVRVPVGVVPGQDLDTVRDTITALEELPIDFVDAYAHHLPADVHAHTDLETWTSCSEDYSHHDILALDRTDVDVIELGLQPKRRYGEGMTTQDLARYRDYAAAFDHPVVIPSQLAITPSDAVALVDGGVTNFLLGAVVTGDTPESVHESVAGFVDALA